MNDPASDKLVPILISLGSNINPEENISAAIQHLSKIDDQILVSTIWESPAVGSSGPNYLNACILMHSSMPQARLKPDLLSEIEEGLGRVRTEDKYADRTIDLDVLIYGSSVTDPELWNQAHLALPASELLPHFQNREMGETLKEVADRLAASTEITPRPDVQDRITSLKLQRYSSP